jgi:hypothetical protein
MKNFMYKHRVLWISLVLSALIILFMSSCSRNGYGCRGKESWKHMVRRINSPK